MAAVPPPNAGVDPNAALQDALARAKQIAAKLQQGGPTAVAAAIAAQEANTSQDTEASEYRKRALEEAGIGNGEPAMKKPAADAVQPGSGDPKALAMQVAANIAQKAGLGSMAVEEIRVPNRFVGLIIGRGGEMINKLQSESGARIQVAPDPPPGQTLSERNITVTGTPSSVSGAKALIGKICEEGKVPDHLAAAQQPGEFATELMIPASKVGLIIGKGGETIRSLQERAGCRMIMIQDGAYTNAPEKPLRISGDPQKCQYGRSLVQDLLTEKELELQSKGEFGSKVSDYGSQSNQGGPTVEMNVPREIVGFVIGKQGDTIKKIQAESGCRVQFKIPDPGNTPHRICVLQGDQACVQKAQALIDDIVSSVSSRQRGGGGGGGPPSRGPPPNAPGVKTVEFPVVANKCGLVIGKGGETIRTICQVSGAHVEINKSIPESAPMKSFTIRGSDGQIQQAQSMIREKVGDQNIGPQNLYGQQMGQGGGSQMGSQQQGQWGSYGYGNMQQQQQQYQQPQQQQYGQSGGQQGAWQQQSYGQYQAPGQQAAQSGQTQTQPGQQASGAQPDYTAAWQAYYQQYYQQYGMQQNTAASVAPAATSAAGGTQAVAGQAAGGPSDYAAWGNYYQQFYPGYQQQQGQQGQQPSAQGGQHPPTS